MKNYNHNTVLLKESIESLNINPSGIYIDATFGGGGHSKLILSKLNNDGKLFSIDRDIESIKIASLIKDKRLHVIHSTFSLLKNYMKNYNLLGKINGIILDLGVSSIQIDDSTRGFSFKKDGPLDCRMDKNNGIPAFKWLYSASEKKICWVLKNFGNERFAKLIARKIFLQNKIKKITRTNELSKIIINSIPCWNKYKHPARRTFQAIRIFINNELEELKIILKNSLLLLAPYGRISIISFHSLEDKIVKNFMIKYSQLPLFIKKLPLTELEIKNNYKNILKIKYLGKKKPSKKEISINYRSRSAILRSAEKLKI